METIYDFLFKYENNYLVLMNKSLSADIVVALLQYCLEANLIL